MTTYRSARFDLTWIWIGTLEMLPFGKSRRRFLLLFIFWKNSIRFLERYPLHAAVLAASIRELQVRMQTSIEWETWYSSNYSFFINDKYRILILFYFRCSSVKDYQQAKHPYWRPHRQKLIEIILFFFLIKAALLS